MEKVVALKQAGVDSIQPGIEALSTSYLERMRKGVTAAMNIALLRYAISADLSLSWNLLYDFPGSICCQMVRLALAEKAVTYNIQTVDITKAAEQFAPEYMALNPSAVVPTLQIGDRVHLDTPNILRRLDEELDGPALTPDDDDEVARMEH